MMLLSLPLLSELICNKKTFMSDKAQLEEQMKKGAEEASYVARRTLSKVQKKLGFVQIR